MIQTDIATTRPTRPRGRVSEKYSKKYFTLESAQKSKFFIKLIKEVTQKSDVTKKSTTKTNKEILEILL